MCIHCGDGFHGIALTERPAQVLHGRWLSDPSAPGSVQGAARALTAQAVQAGGWRSPVVVLNWSTAGDGRCFVGVASDLAGEESVELQEATFAACWHSGSPDAVVARYGQMLEWIGAEALQRDAAPFAHREEYPPDGPFDGSAVRLMVPVVASRPSIFAAS